MKRQTILVIEDEKNIVELLKYNLEKQGFNILCCQNGQDGLSSALKEKPALILLDLMLPEITGMEICKILRQNYKTHDIPVIMLTAKSDEADIVLGLELGADDYVTKPFSPRQLTARIRAVLRRFEARPETKFIKAGPLEMDTARHIVTIGGNPVDLTFKEYLVLKYLLESQGRVLSRDAILDAVWGYDESLEVEIRVVDKHIGELRKKLQAAAAAIITIKNFGYRFDTELLCA